MTDRAGRLAGKRVMRGDATVPSADRGWHLAVLSPPIMSPATQMCGMLVCRCLLTLTCPSFVKLVDEYSQRLASCERF